MAKVAVVLSGCGHRDGSEIREAVLSLLYLDQQGADVQLFAPDQYQAKVTNHLTGKETDEKRNVLVESARIARGEIKPLSAARADQFDALVLPGGFGAALNLSDFALKGCEAQVIPDLRRLAHDFWQQKKPIGAICIAPAVLVAAIGKDAHPTVTIGNDSDTAAAIVALGGRHQDCQTTAVAVDAQNRIASCSAYMRNDRLSNIAEGIEKVIKEVMRMAKQTQQKAA